jgi:hypothetical protein
MQWLRRSPPEHQYGVIRRGGFDDAERDLPGWECMWNSSGIAGAPESLKRVIGNWVFVTGDARKVVQIKVINRI